MGELGFELGSLASESALVTNVTVPFAFYPLCHLILTMDICSRTILLASQMRKPWLGKAE